MVIRANRRRGNIFQRKVPLGPAILRSRGPKDIDRLPAVQRPGPASHESAHGKVRPESIGLRRVQDPVVNCHVFRVINLNTIVQEGPDPSESIHQNKVR